jgi:cyclophilin family peptidyl-prolyl cis-trans isomerase
MAVMRPYATICKGFWALLTSVAAIVTVMPAQADNPRVELATERGLMIVELYAERAPISVANFISLVNNHHYDGLIFHRVISGFMIQTGGFTFDMTPREPGTDNIVNESTNGLTNKRGTLAMARTNDPNSARAQFFINHRNNSSLNMRGDSAGYAVFGKVVEGMRVLDAIARVRTGNHGPYQNVPLEPIRIVTAKLLNPDAWTGIGDTTVEPSFERPIPIR